jgi:hypothetical protein
VLYKNLIYFRSSLTKLPETQAFNLPPGGSLCKKQRQNYTFFPNPQTLVLKNVKLFVNLTLQNGVLLSFCIKSGVKRHSEFVWNVVFGVKILESDGLSYSLLKLNASRHAP